MSASSPPAQGQANSSHPTENRQQSDNVIVAYYAKKVTDVNSLEEISENMNQLPQLVSGMLSDDPSVQFDCTIKVREILSKEKKPPLEAVVAIENGAVIPTLVAFLDRAENPILQFEACWALTNIAVGASEFVDRIVQHGAIPRLVALVSNRDANIAEQAVWALGNIAAASLQLRDLVLKAGVAAPLFALIRHSCHMGVMRTAVWALSNLCRKKPPPRLELLPGVVELLLILLYVRDEQTLSDTCYTLFFLADSVNQFLRTGFVERVVQLLLFQNSAVVLPALRLIGQILAGDNQVTQLVLDTNVLVHLPALLQGNHEDIQAYACLAISNITAGTTEQIEAVFAANLVPLILNLLRNGAPNTRKEAAWALANACAGGSATQLDQLIEAGVFLPLCDMLSCTSANLVRTILIAVNRMLSVPAAAVSRDLLTQLKANNYHIAVTGLTRHSTDGVSEMATQLARLHLKNNDPVESPAPPQPQ